MARAGYKFQFVAVGYQRYLIDLRKMGPILLANPGLPMIAPFWGLDRTPQQGNFWALK